MAEVAGVSSGIDGGGVYVVTEATRSVDGHDGFTTLDFGTFQATWRYLWNAPAGSGETYDVRNVETGAHWSIDFQNISSLVGSPYNDHLVADAQITSLFGGGGDDTLESAMDSPNPGYLRGGDGNDSLVGGETFDDINGNQGNDTAHGWEGDDWVVGGKGDDLLYGDTGDDIVWGNLGDDTCDGGEGDDQLRGGQGDDSLSGGPGNDFISGDRGNDTEAGGPGADIFHTSQDAGIDRVLDFHLSEGDRVMLDPGTTYKVSQVGEDTVIDMGGGNQMILVGVQMSTLNGDWIFGA